MSLHVCLCEFICHCRRPKFGQEKNPTPTSIQRSNQQIFFLSPFNNRTFSLTFLSKKKPFSVILWGTAKDHFGSSANPEVCGKAENIQDGRRKNQLTLARTCARVPMCVCVRARPKSFELKLSLADVSSCVCVCVENLHSLAIAGSCRLPANEIQIWLPFHGCPFWNVFMLSQHGAFVATFCSSALVVSVCSWVDFFSFSFCCFFG